LGQAGRWKKIFGITGGIRPANELDEIIDKPGDPKTWKKIQELAARNTELYEAAFPSIPRNHPLGRKTSASIWPIWDPSLRNPEGHKGAKVGFMPFDREFWSTRQHTASAANLAEVKGYITLLPIKWTTGENNNLGYHTALVTENNVAPLPQDPIRQVQASTDRGNA
jgi:phospholipase D1/2